MEHSERVVAGNDGDPNHDVATAENKPMAGTGDHLLALPLPLARASISSSRHSGTAFASPPFPVNPMDNPSGGLLVAKNCHRVREKRTTQNRRMSFFARHPSMTASADWGDVM